MSEKEKVWAEEGAAETGQPSSETNITEAAAETLAGKDSREPQESRNVGSTFDKLSYRHEESLLDAGQPGNAQSLVSSLETADKGVVKQEGDSVEQLKPEITDIIEQFSKEQGGGEDGAALSPTRSKLPVFHYPPRTSSLEHRRDSGADAEKRPSAAPDGPSDPEKGQDEDAHASLEKISIHSQPPPPQPDPEPALPFDFHRFLDQLRHRTADPVAKFLRSFLIEFGKKQWQVHEQQKIVSDFLAFISNKMAQCEVWRTVSDAEFDNAREGMEKLVMNRLYTQTFSPEIPPGDNLPVKVRRKGSGAGSGRRGQHQEDVERDEVLAQKVRIYGWVQERHLDIPSSGEKGDRFLKLAQKELLKINSYRAPRDKVICVLNCCKVIFGFLRNVQSDQSADSFIPLLIYTVIKAHPEHLVSNVEYILRFRSQEKLSGETGYYMSSLLGAVHFIENLDRTSLTVEDEEFEKNVEAAVSAIAEKHEQHEKRLSSPLLFNEKSTPSRPEVTPRHSMEGERARAHRAASKVDPNGLDENEENAAVTGLLRSIQKPLSTIGRMFLEDGTEQSDLRPPSTPQPPPQTQPNPNRDISVPTAQISPTQATQRAAAEDAAARQASAEAAEAQRITRVEHQTVVDTLSGMFPDLDKDVISDVVRGKQGRIGQAVDACLSLSR